MEAVDNRELRSEKQGSSDEGNSSIPTEQTEDVGTAKNVTTLGRLEAKPHPKTEPVQYGTITIIPDTPIGELLTNAPGFLNGRHYGRCGNKQNIPRVERP